MEVTQILLSAQNPDLQIRAQAEKQLEEARDNQFPLYMSKMIEELSAEQKPLEARMLAGLLIKNALWAKSEAQYNIHRDRWLKLDEQTRVAVKNGALQTLTSQHPNARTTACSVVSKLAAIELPNGSWPECIPQLKAAASQVEDVNARHGALVAIGYICQDLSELDQSLDGQANDILTAVIQGLQEEQNMDIKYVSAQALNNALEFASENFEKDNERNYIMEQLCNATQTSDVRVRKEAMDCLGTVAYHYYGRLPQYIEKISQITIKAIKGDEQDVGTAALEFWSTVLEEEEDLMEEEAEGLLNISVQAAPFFVPVLLECLTKQTGDEDDDEWTVYKAAGVCLELMARCARDAVVTMVMDFVNANVTSQNWIQQDAATLAFGALLQGPSAQSLQPWVNQATQAFLKTLVNSGARVEVRDTSAWAVARILENHPSLVDQSVFPDLLHTLLKCLEAEPRVAVHICYALEQLTQHIESLSQGEVSTTNQLSGVMAPLLTGLVQAADRPDASEVTQTGHDLMTCAYDALDVLVKGSAPDCAPLMAQLLPVIMRKLQLTFNATANGEPQKAQVANMQSMCCGVLMALCTKLDKSVLEQNAEPMMQCFLQCFKTNATTTYEEAFMAIGVLATELGQSFARFMPTFFEYLKAGLENTQEYSVCLAAVGVVGDLCRALEAQILPHCDAIMLQLMRNLVDQHLHRTVKPPILTTFGDIALAVGADFKSYLEHALTMLHNASQIQMDTSDPDDYDYMVQLQQNIIEGYSGIVQALSHCQRAELLNNYLATVFDFLANKITPVENRDSGITKCAINLVGDLAMGMKGNARPFLTQPWVQHLFSSAPAAECQEEAEWAYQQIQRAIS
jgi:importin subunit beta-1